MPKLKLEALGKVQVRSIANCFYPTVHICCRDAKTKKCYLGGPVGEILNQYKIPMNWIYKRLEVQASGMYGTVDIYFEIDDRLPNK